MAPRAKAATGGQVLRIRALSAASGRPRALARSTMSIAIWVTLPVIMVVGARWVKTTRAATFCTAMATTPVNPASMTGGALALRRARPTRSAA
jgi:hypothetical protein